MGDKEQEEILKPNISDSENQKTEYSEDFKKRIESLYLNLKIEKNAEEVRKLHSTYLESEEKLISSGRIERKDLKFSTTNKDVIYKEKKKYHYIENIKYVNYLFTRAVATDFIFVNIDFSKTIFDNCYLRDCRFERCNFEGAKFNNCNLQGSYFDDCKFDYVIFEKTFVDDEIFECAPRESNLKYKFARALKLNYASIGDYMRASKAVNYELDATKKHLLDSWLLNSTWHYLKYKGIGKRWKQFRKWFEVAFLDFIWGNGESLWRLIRFNLIIFFILTLYHYFEKPETTIFDFLEIFLIKVPANYFSLKISLNSEFFSYYSTGLTLILNISRLVFFALLMSVITKKYNRR